MKFRIRLVNAVGLLGDGFSALDVFVEEVDMAVVTGLEPEADEGVDKAEVHGAEERQVGAVGDGGVKGQGEGFCFFGDLGDAQRGIDVFALTGEAGGDHGFVGKC